jgi:hypothetical protein
MCDAVDEEPWCSAHVSWLVRVDDWVAADSTPVEVYEFRHRPDSAIMSAWARHFRNHYCLDCEVDAHAQGTGLCRTEFLKQRKFPDCSTAPGPSIRAGDFAEILVADYLEFLQEFWVPRVRYAARAVRNQSTQGSDVVGFKMVDLEQPSKTDTLAVYEAKAQLTGSSGKSRLQDAVNDSAKDDYRLAETLSAIKQRLLDKGHLSEGGWVERFQNPVDRPYAKECGAVAVFATECLDPAEIATTTTSGHPQNTALKLIVISGDAMMELVHVLYERAANEA